MTRQRVGRLMNVGYIPEEVKGYFQLQSIQTGVKRRGFKTDHQSSPLVPRLIIRGGMPPFRHISTNISKYIRHVKVDMLAEFFNL